MRSVQVFLTPAEGKRLIARALMARADMREALFERTVVIVAGTTNAYVAQEALLAIGDAEGFAADAFHRGVTAPPGSVERVEFPGDVVIRQGRWSRGETIYDAAPKLVAGDVILKGANAVHLATGEAGVLIANPEGGTIAVISQAVIGKRARLIMPVGVEKRVELPIHALAERCNAPEAKGLRMSLAPGRAFTELDALAELTHGGEAVLLAGGGVKGYEGGVYFLVTGEESAVGALSALRAEG